MESNAPTKIKLNHELTFC